MFYRYNALTRREEGGEEERRRGGEEERRRGGEEERRRGGEEERRRGGEEERRRGGEEERRRGGTRDESHQILKNITNNLPPYLHVLSILFDFNFDIVRYFDIVRLQY